MAITADRERSLQALDSRFAPLAGIVSITLTLAGAAMMIVYLTTVTGPPSWVMAVGVIKLIGAAVLAGVGVKLLRLRPWAQQVLLVVWLIALAQSVVILLGWLLWGQPAWWNTYVTWSLPALVIPMLAASAATSALLVRSAAPGTRQRYGSMVCISIVVALAVAVVVNMIAQNDYGRWDVQALGRYGLSGRTRTVLKAIDKDLRLTCVYTSAQKDKKAEDYRPRTLEMLEEVRETLRKLGKDAKVENVTTVAQKAAVDARLRGRQLSGQAGHVALLREQFLPLGDKALADLENARRQWGQMPPDSYLSAWNVTTDVAILLKKAVEKLQTTRREVDADLNGAGLPDLPKLAEKVKAAVTEGRDSLKSAAEGVQVLREIPGEVAKRRKETLEGLAACDKAVKSLMEMVRKAQDDKAAKPGEVLQKFAAAARDTVKKVDTASLLLSELAGKENRRIILASAPYGYRVPVAGLALRSDLVTALSKYVAGQIQAMAEKVEAVLKSTTVEYQKQVLSQLPPAVSEPAATFGKIHASAVAAVEKLSKVDQPTQAIFEQAKGG